MKKISLLIVVVMMLLCLISCGNKAFMSMGEYSFTHVHISDDIKGYCATVEKWWDNESGIEVRTSEFGSLFCSEGTYMLFSDESKCPYCK